MHRKTKESPGRAGALGSRLEERPDTTLKRATRYHPKALRLAIRRIEMRGYSP
jgi:hypothetical protein